MDKKPFKALCKNIIFIFVFNFKDSDILELANILIEHNEKLDEFGVIDPNFKKNAEEILKILSKKVFWQSMVTIENILKIEREKKIEKLSNNLFLTVGPNLLFKAIFSLLELIKNNKHEIILEYSLENIKEIIIQYLLGVDTIIRVIFFNKISKEI